MLTAHPPAIDAPPALFLAPPFLLSEAARPECVQSDDLPLALRMVALDDDGLLAEGEGHAVSGVPKTSVRPVPTRASSHA